MKKIVILLLISFPIVAISQNVGIGTTTPVTKLNIIGTSSGPSIPGSSSTGIFRIGTGAFEGVDFGKLSNTPFSAWMQAGYNGVTPDPLSLQPLGGNIGIGIISPAYKLDISGDINLSGSLRVNGNSGTAGQVLTSNGTADPVWQTMLSNYPIDGRIMIPVSNTSIPSQISVNLNLGIPIYNTFGPNISVGTNSVTINVTGLYELEGNLLFETGLVSIPTTYASGNPYASLRILADYGLTSASFLQIFQRVDLFSPRDPSSNLYTESIPFRLVTRIPGGTILNFSANIFQYTTDICCDAPPRVNEGYISINRVN